MAAFLAVGVYGTLLTPKEEEPQIDVPMADIFIGYPGASPSEVEKKISIPLEKILSNIEGVEYVYSTSMPQQAMVSAQFYVGEDVERSLVRLYNEIMKHMDRMPENSTLPLIKTRSIDDVPIMTLTFWSPEYSDYALRRLVEEYELQIRQVQDVARTKIHGGRSRQIRVELDLAKMASYKLDPFFISEKISSASHKFYPGSYKKNDTQILVEAGSFFTSAEDIANLVVDVRNGEPVYLESVAAITDGAENPLNYVAYGAGKGLSSSNNVNAGQTFPAVTISVAKRPGTDAMTIASDILDKTEQLKGSLIPSDVQVTVTRNYGKTASQKVVSLLEHLLAAVIAVTIVVVIAMGWRGGLVVFLSVPVTFALTLFVYYMFGYTLNRITLFALVFVTGIVVDDAIIITENMHRHFKMGKLPFRQAAIASINEVGNPTILATFTVIAAVLPMAFVSGLMGPYMSPMPIGASLAMIFSLFVALMIVPWIGFKLLPAGARKEREHSGGNYKLEDTLIYKYYKKAMTPLLENIRYRWAFIISVTVVLFASMLLFYFRTVEVKMLPFDNKNEIQLIIDMPEGTTLENTHAAAREIALALTDVPEVLDYQVYSGTHAPINFNGLVRHYDLRESSNIADIQVNLLDKSERSDQSHDIAKRIRPLVQKAGERYGANVKVVEVPPGPPVLSTLVAEIYGPDQSEHKRIGEEVMRVFKELDGVVDVDWMVEAPQTQMEMSVLNTKARISGVEPVHVTNAISAAIGGHTAAQLSSDVDLNPVPVVLQIPDSDKSGTHNLGRIHVMSDNGMMIPLETLIEVTEEHLEPSIYRKNQRRVTYVTAEVAGAIESPVYAILDAGEEIDRIELPAGYSLQQIFAGQPFMTDDYTLKWDGEWQITYEVFRDLGIAFAVVLVIIYMLIIGWFQDFKVPVVMMIAIPLSLVGIIIGHWVFGAFFTATSMIGMIALAGIMVRNSVLLIDFINLRLEDGIPFKQAVIEGGAVRTLPILLTAGTVVIAAIVILFDPIFQGLAISLMGGAIASTALTLLMVPLIYFMTEEKEYIESTAEAKK